MPFETSVATPVRSHRMLFGLLFAACLCLSLPKPAHAQFAVIDVASIAQLAEEVQQLEQQVATAKAQLSQAQSEYAAITGGRGMDQLLAGTSRNYLPADWSQLSQVLSGGGTFPSLSADFNSILNGNTVLTPAQASRLTVAQQAQLTAARQSPALLQALSRAALSNSSERFPALQQLITALGSAQDEKASLDLSARVAAEQTMVVNEQTKLQSLYQVAQSQQWALDQRLREQAIADQGSLRSLPAMGL